MSDAQSQAVKDRREAEEWLEGHGWERFPFWRGSSYWTDSTHPDPLQLHEAIEVQNDRINTVHEVMES